MLNKTKIVCTIGERTESPEVIEEMLLAGMNVARLNLANGNLQTQNRYIDALNKASLIHDRTLSIMIDTLGPKAKTHSFENSICNYSKGSKITIYTNKEVTGNEQEFSTSYEGLYDDVNVGDRMYVNHGLLNLEVISKNEKEKTIECEVRHSGQACDYSQINVPTKANNLPILSEFDQSIIQFAKLSNVDFIGASFVRNAEDVKVIKEAVKDSQNTIKVFAKIENKEAVENFDEILNEADGIIIARGDLSIEVTPEELPIYQKKMIKKANIVGKPILVSTQILSSMTRNKQPSRAEVSDLCNLVLDGVDGILLANVTTVGNYPIYAVKEAAKIIKVTEEHAKEIYDLNNQVAVLDPKEYCLDEAVAASVIETAKQVNAKLIVAFSESGATAKRISRYRPSCPIASVSSDSSIRQSLTLNWGIYPVVANHKTFEFDFENYANEIAIYYGLVEGETFIITGGNGVGNTNLMKVCKVK